MPIENSLRWIRSAWVGLRGADREFGLAQFQQVEFSSVTRSVDAGFGIPHR